MPLLEKHYCTGDHDAQWWVIRTLAAVKAAGRNALLEKALKHPDQSIVQCALLACRYHISPHMVSIVIPYLSAREHLTARLAGDVLVNLGSEAVSPLLEWIEERGSPPAVEEIRVLAKIAHPRAVPLLFQLLDSESVFIRHWAEIGLENMGIGMVFFELG